MTLFWFLFLFPVAVLCMFSLSEKGCHCVLWSTLLACYLFLKASWFTQGLDAYKRLQSPFDADKTAVQLWTSQQHICPSGKKNHQLHFFFFFLISQLFLLYNNDIKWSSTFACLLLFRSFSWEKVTSQSHVSSRFWEQHLNNVSPCAQICQDTNIWNQKSDVFKTFLIKFVKRPKSHYH